MINLYETIFIAQITSFSIVLPIFFAFAQMTTREYTSVYTMSLIHDFRIIIYMSISILVIISSILVLLLMNSGVHDYIPFAYLHSRQIYTWKWFPVILIILFILSFLPILLFILHRVRNLDSKFVIEADLKNKKTICYESYLIGKYGPPWIPPIDNIVNNVSENSKILSKHKHLNKVRKLSMNNDPFYVTRNILNYNLINTNISQFDGGLHSFVESWIIIINKIKKSSLCDSEIVYLCKEYVDIFELLFQESNRLSSNYIALKILEATNRLIEIAIYYEQQNAAIDFAITAENYIIANRLERLDVAFGIVSLFDKSIKTLFESSNDEEVKDNIWRVLGRTGERIIKSYEILDQPLMMGLDNKYLYHEVLEVFWRYVEYVKDNYSNEYPLLLLDTNYCIFLSLINREKNEPEKRVKHLLNSDIHSMVYHTLSLYKMYILVENYKAASLVGFRSIEIYKELVTRNKIDIIVGTIEYFIEMGFIASTRKTAIDNSLFSGTLEGEVLEFIAEYQGQLGDISTAIREIMIKNQSGMFSFHDADEFYFDLCRIYQSSLGLNSNWRERRWD